MAMLAIEIAEKLKALNLISWSGITSTGGNCFIDWMPDTPDTAVGIYSNNGLKDDGTSHQHHLIQIVTRGTKDPRVAYNLASGIYGGLIHFNGARLVTSGTWIVQTYAQNCVPARIGPDDKGRHRYSLNFHFMTDPTKTL